MPWGPTKIRRVVRVIGTSTRPLYVETDAGFAYCKAMGNPQGPDVLTCDLVGTWLGGWLKVPTLDFAVLEFPEALRTDLGDGHVTQAAPAFLTRAVGGFPWGGDRDELASVENVRDLAGFVVLDSWTRNCDRHCIRAGQERRNLENVLLTGEKAKAGHVRALAIDHGCAFVCGRALRARDLKIDAVRDETLYGLFHGFKDAVTEIDTARFTQRLRAFGRPDADECLRQVPRAWGCGVDTVDAVKEFCLERAAFVAERVERWLEEPCGWHTFLPKQEAQ